MPQRPTKTVFLVASLALFAAVCAAEQTQPSGVHSLDECIRIALENQVDVILARNQVVAARSRTARAISAYLPQISIQNNAFRWGSGSVLNQVTTGTALDVTQNVFDGGLREANASSARYGETQSSARLSRTVQTVVFKVTKAFYEVLRAKHLADVAQKDVTYNQELVDKVKFSAEKGYAAEADVLPVEAQLANARVNLLSANNAVRTAALALQNEMGVSPQADFEVEDVTRVEAIQPQPLASYVSHASSRRPEVLELKAGSSSARASVRAARINLYPKPVISAQYQRRVSGGFTTGGGQMVGGVVFDLFDGGANRAAYKEARANQANAEAQEKQIYRDIQVQVEEAYLNLTSAQDRLAASELGLAAAQKNYDAQQAKYDEGVAILLDVLNAEVQLVTAQTNAVQARYDYLIALAQLDYAVGR